MGRQFKYYCLPSDLDEIHDVVFKNMGGQLLECRKSPNGNVLVPVDGFATPYETRALVLAPPESLTRVVMMGQWIDTGESNLIEVGGCVVIGEVLHGGRLWYQPKCYTDRVYGDKSSEFLAWAQSVFARTKKLLTRSEVEIGGHPFVEWFGKEAWKEVSGDHLRIALN
jgi:hypothetical protein